MHVVLGFLVPSSAAMLARADRFPLFAYLSPLESKKIILFLLSQLHEVSISLHSQSASYTGVPDLFQA